MRDVAAAAEQRRVRWSNLRSRSRFLPLLVALAVQVFTWPARAQATVPEPPGAPTAQRPPAPATSQQATPLEPEPASSGSDAAFPPRRDRPSRPIVWRSGWPRFGTADWIITGAGAAIALASAIIPPQPRHIYGGALFDEGVRDAIRLRNPQARYNARDASDVILSLEATWPFFVDALITTWWFRDSRDAAVQMALVDEQALAIVTAIQGATNTIASRERPYGRTCGTPDQPEQTVECEGNVRYRSFFSGHAAFAFMSAGLICTHHLQHGLFGGAWDPIACIVGYTGAAATATLRVMGDMHYATDVLTGALVGTVVGVAVPLFHYRNVTGSDGTKTGRANNVDVSLIPVGAGLGLGGTF